MRYWIVLNNGLKLYYDRDLRRQKMYIVIVAVTTDIVAVYSHLYKSNIFIRAP